MLFVWWLLLLGIVKTNSQNPLSTTVDPITEADLEETATLKRYLQKYDDQCTGNSELTIWMDKLLRASKLPKSKLAEKIATRIGFESYNQERLNLESSINARLEELDDILPQQIPNSRCSKFYLKQRTNLRKAKSLPNAKKSVVLLENSKACPKENYEIYEYDYEYR